MSTPKKTAKKPVKKPAKKTNSSKVPTGKDIIVGYKAVNADLTSIHDAGFVYKIGQEAVVTDPNPRGTDCGRGIHFSRTMDYPYDFAGYKDDRRSFYEDCAMLELRVNTKDIIDENDRKARASKVFVVGVVKPEFPDYGPLSERAYNINKKLGNNSCQLPEKNLRDLFTSFTRRNNLKGYSLKIVTSAIEAQWYAEKLEYCDFNFADVESPTDVSIDDDFDGLFSNLDDLFDDMQSDNSHIAGSAQWIFNCLSTHVKHTEATKSLDAEPLAKMLEAGAIPLGVSHTNVVYWFAPSTVRLNWFPRV